MLLGYSIFYPYKGMDDQIFKKPIRPGKDDCLTHKSPGIESLSIWFFKKYVSEKNLVSNPKKGNCTNLSPGKMYLQIQTPGKKHNQRIPFLWKLVSFWFFSIGRVSQPSTRYKSATD